MDAQQYVSFYQDAGKINIYSYLKGDMTLYNIEDVECERLFSVCACKIGLIIA